MKWCILILFFVFSNLFFCQDYYGVNSKIFFEKGYSDDTVNLEKINLGLLQASILHVTNLERSRKRQFDYDKNLEKAAVFHSKEMLNLEFFSHTNRKNKKYKSPFLRAKKFRAKYEVIGENILEEIAVNYKENSLYTSKIEGEVYVFYHHSTEKKIRELTYKELAEKVVASWMHSAGHKANILDKSYSHLGVGVAIKENPFDKDELPTIFVTQLFGGN